MNLNNGNLDFTNPDKLGLLSLNISSDTADAVLNPTVIESVRINDTRPITAFKIQTFGGYNRNQAFTALDKSMNDDRHEPAVHWGFQLFLSGVTIPLWERIILHMIKYINTGNPTLPGCIYSKTVAFYNYMTKYNNKTPILAIRNNPDVRLLITEFITIASLSKKRKLETLPKIKPDEFIISVFKSRLEAPNNTYAADIVRDGDPSEIRIAINELAYQIQKKNTRQVCYWLAWIIEWDALNTKKYGKFECAHRSIINVDVKYGKLSVWLVWDIIKKMISAQQTLEAAQINSLFQLYTYRFTPAAKSRRIGLIVWAVLYLTTLIDWHVPLIDRPYLLFQSMLNTNKLIIRMKSQEVINPSMAQSAEAMKLVVKNDVIIPENHIRMVKEKIENTKAKEAFDREQLAKKKKISLETLNKLDTLAKLDKYMCEE